jgi:cytochrome c peroxidase
VRKSCFPIHEKTEKYLYQRENRLAMRFRSGSFSGMTVRLPTGLCAFIVLTAAVPFPSVLSALQLDPVPPPLKGIPIPATPGLLDGPEPIIVDKVSAIRLGKALFWDMNVGSDGVACATCHFHAGADHRTRNQLGPGGLHGMPAGKTYEKTASGAAGGVNYELKAADFPLFRHENPADRHSRVLYSTDDVVSSSGVSYARFQADPRQDAEGRETCAPLPDDVFHLGGANVRRVSERNAPTVINAVFNYRVFWDGRANNLFNGATPYGARDPAAGVWEVREGKLSRVRLRLENAALASQAVAPPLSDKEMSCAGRTFPDLARKLLGRRPLDRQRVHAGDSVLAADRDSSGVGLKSTYESLIRQSFAERYWSGTGDFGGSGKGGAPYRQMEANFAFFFALAIQMYESTLVSDETPFDSLRGPDGYPSAFDARQKRGLDLFNKAECDFCHHGPGFSAAHHPAVFAESRPGQPPKLVDRRVLSVNRANKSTYTPLLDVGYANTGVVPNEFDPGLGGRDPLGHPLSFAEQYLATLADPGKPMADPVNIAAFNFSLGFRMGFASGELIAPSAANGFHLGNPEQAAIPAPRVVREELARPGQGRLPSAVQGAFKVPTLRNVELTGPYMHNGSLKNLEEVVDFYDRGGNLENREHFDTFVFPQHFTPWEKADLLAFLKALTDERVRWEKAPFDHPSLRVPNGMVTSPAGKNGGRPREDWLVIPAVGRHGRSKAQGPLQPFESFLGRD